MSTSHKDLDFSFVQNILLLKIKFFGISKETVYHQEKYTFLIRYSLLKHLSKDNQRFRLNDKGHMYLRYKFRKFFSFWIPTTIAIIALFGGYDVYTNPVLKALLEAIKSLFETIAENLGVVL